MTVTITVDNGPTVRLTYDGKWVRRPFLPHTHVEIRDQPLPARRDAAAPRWLPQLLGIAATLLLLYGTGEKVWPPDLRAAAEQLPGVPT
jgi:hypothetical protein